MVLKEKRLAQAAQNEHFEIDASVVFQLGESLITDAVQALMELVKNSYDADASYCKVVISTSPIENPQSPFHGALGSIIIEDDGTGMDLDTIRSGWLTISNSGKRLLKKRSGTTSKGRTPLGDKGLGRLGTQRLGKNLEMTTRTAGSPIQQHVWFSWDDFVDQRVLSEIEIRREEEPPSFSKGTRLAISGLRDLDVWKGDGRSELEARLSQIISPYRAVRDFVVHANVDGSDLEPLELSGRLRDFAQLRYSLQFDGDLLSIVGRARIAYLRPEASADLNDRARFKQLIEEDNGERFFAFLNTKKRAPDFCMERLPESGWFVSFKKVISLSMDKAALINNRPANPGPFSGEVDFFSLSSESSAELQSIYTMQQYRETVEKLAGIKVYRDGFGIPVSTDWLSLGSQWTKARSYYTLKPQNTLGYIAISAKENGNLQEKTDREGFTDNAYFRNFMGLLSEFVGFSADAQQFLRRGYNDFCKAVERENANIPPELTPENLAVNLGAVLKRAAQHQYSVRDAALRLNNTIREADELLTGIGTEDGRDLSVDGVRGLVTRLREHTAQAAKSVMDAQEYLQEASQLSAAGGVLAGQISDLREQIQQVYEIIGLGLTAEALSHEINNVITQLGERTKKTSQLMKAMGSKDLKLFTYFSYVEAAVSALRRQMTFLDPTLRYAREKREEIDLNAYCNDIQQHYNLHFLGSSISFILVKPQRPVAFRILMNKGKVVQILDNLVLNSEYWLKESFRSGAARGTVTLELKRPYLLVSDSGPGIDPTVEHSLFEPFVSTKGKGRGRGLGLFVVQQLLRSDGCDIALTPRRNSKDRLYQFEIDLTGVLIS